ncbi:hypothetical protein ACEW7V_00655 [Areca yellow leaf disease phytoplasma]|uniref:hypothetical protein n=1 Tax=Areca yellow leaf disease phytoplasma TaxID=927614 RepID=UPI0035B51EF7
MRQRLGQVEVEEKAMVAVALMEAAKKEVAKAIPEFKASNAFINKVREVVFDAFLKGFEDCKKKVG